MAMPKLGERETFLLAWFYVVCGNTVALVTALKVLDPTWLAITIFALTNIAAGIQMMLNGGKLPAASPSPSKQPTPIV